MRKTFAYSLALSLAALACGGSHGSGYSNGVAPTDGGGPSSTGPGAPEGGAFGPGGDAGGSGTGECNATTKLVYVVSEENTLYSFTPETLTFAPIGLLGCNSGGATPTSMAVDRNGFAWVLLTDGGIYKVSVKDASCSSTKYAAGQVGFTKFGMGFSTDAAGGSAEALYLSDHDGKGLAKLDTGTLAVSPVGPYTGALTGLTSELTGTGDGKLYGFFTTSPATIAEIDKKSGAILSQQSLANTYAGTAWAFSSYAGDFYVYTADNSGSGLPLNGTGSDVTRYRPSDGTVKVVKSKIGFRIVGAGVSTCAPTTPVK